MSGVVKICYAIGLITLYLLLPTTVAAQQYNYRHYTTRDGLPSMVVYYVMQDSQGFIWIATKEGLSRYDGYRFKTFTTDDGLPDNEIIGVYEDKYERVWAYPFRNKLSYIVNDSVHVVDNIQEDKLPIRRMLTDQKGHIWLSRVNGLLTEYSDSIISTYDPKVFFNSEFARLHGYADTSGNVWLVSDSLLIRIDAATNATKQWVVRNEQFTFNSARLLEISNSQTIYLFNNLVLLKWVGDSAQVIFNGEIAGHPKDIRLLNLTITSNEDLLIGTSQGAYRIKQKPSGEKTVEHFLDGKSIGKVIEDREGNLWFSTVSEGLYMMTAASGSVTNIGAEDGLFKTMPGRIFVFNDTLAVSSKDGEVYSINLVGDNRFELQPQSINIMSESLGACVEIPEHGTWCASGMGLHVFNGKALGFNNWNINTNSYLDNRVVKVPKTINLFNFSTIKGLAVGTDGKVWTATANGLYQVDLLPDSTYYNVRLITSNRASAVTIDQQGTVWVSFLDGLHYWQPDTLIPIAGIKSLVNHMTTSSNGIVWVSSARGLYGYKGINDSTPLHFTTKHGLPSNIVNHILETPRGLLLSTDKGICLVTASKTGTYNVVPLLVNDGFVSKEVSHSILWRDKLVALTAKGVSVIDTAQLATDTAAPILHFTLVNIAGKDTTVLPQYTLPYASNSIRLEYVGLSYKSDGDIMYRYRMEGIDTGWVQTSFTNVQYPALAPGRYTFKVDARSLQGPWSGKPIAMGITILPPFWKTWWFRLAMVVLIASIVIGVSYAIISYYRNQSRIAQRMVELEGQALRANMNPHFVFNALNAIHDFIADQDQRSAHLYLGKFAQLIRRILEQSRKNTISLEDELDTLQLYLELENMRFEHKFDYNFIFGTDIQPFDIEIPPMLIQPYLENAVRHGLMNLDEPGNINIQFEKLENTLKCTIIDNGIGRDKAAAISSSRLKSHRSAGMEITQKRVQLLNDPESKGRSSGVTITDLYDESGKPKGTKVELILPLND